MAVLYITFTPHGVPPNQDWRFTIDGTRQYGFSPGGLRRAVSSVLALAAGGGLVVTVPRARWRGLLPVRFVVRSFYDLGHVPVLDVAVLRKRFAKGARWRARWDRLRRIGSGLPGAWPAAP